MNKKIVLATAALSLALATPSLANDINTLSCRDIIDNGWSNMPDVSDTVLARPHASLLGFGSPCHINSMVFAECFIDMHVTVGAAIKSLLKKATTGSELPYGTVCGA